jgi:uncharacterized protein (TIGR03086 family)
MTDLRVLHRRALQLSVDVVDRVTPRLLGLPTPCAQWDLGQLVAHMTGQNLGFAAAARGERNGVEAFAPVPDAEDPAARHAASAALLGEAFAAEGFEQRELWLAEIRGGGFYPARSAVGFHLVDSVAHAWDVARALGEAVAFDDEVLEAALGISVAIPDGAAREQPGAAFRPVVAVPAHGTLLDRVLGLLGRSPDWKP